MNNAKEWAEAFTIIAKYTDGDDLEGGCYHLELSFPQTGVKRADRQRLKELGWVFDKEFKLIRVRF